MPQFPQAMTGMAALHYVPEARRKSPLQRVTIWKHTAVGDGASRPLLFHAREFAWEACTREKSPLPLGLLSWCPGRALVGDELLKWEGSGALSVCVECV